MGSFSRNLLKNLALIIFGIVFCTLIIEIGLRTWDPHGIFAVFENQRRLNNRLLFDEYRYFVQGEGYYQLLGWDMTITAQNTRTVPGTSHDATGCHIAFVGDSATMAIGVDDNETWVSLLAREMPDVHITNAGVIGYNTEHVRHTVDALSADAYVYLIYPNDNSPTYEASAPRRYRRFVSAFMRYAGIPRHTPATPNDEVFDRELENLDNRDNVLIIGFSTDTLVTRTLADHPDRVVPVRAYTKTVSRSDFHANEEGNQQLYENTRDVILPFVEEQCNE